MPCEGLAEPLVERHRQAGQVGERLGGAGRPGEVGGDNRVRVQGGQDPRGAFGLGHADVVERDVALALEAVLEVPRRAAVAPHDDLPVPRCRAALVPP